MKIYTRTGDTGTTSLVGGTRIAKDAARIEAYGTVDELNSYIGVLTAYPKCPPEERTLLIHVQNKLFNLGAYLATPSAATAGISDSDIELLENSIDRMEHMVPPVDQFILPGGCTLSAQAHVARTIARRAERRILAMATAEHTAVAPTALAFINRLSDWFYMFARYNNVISDASETFWNKNC